MYHPALGDKVRTRYKFYGRNRHGKIIGIDGSYIRVRLKYKNILIEAYPNELDKIFVVKKG